MTDSPPPSSQSPEPGRAHRAATSSTPRFQAIRNAARPHAQGLGTSNRRSRGGTFQERAADAVLNSFAIVGELVDDFQNADRFFKYKALVLFLWLASAVGAFGIACPSTGPRNTIRAHLVVAGDPAAPVYMVKNQSGELWQDVEIIVNGRYRSTLAQLEAAGSLTISPAVIFDSTGNRAPSGLHVTDIEVRVTEPGGAAILLKGGERQKE